MKEINSENFEAEVLSKKEDSLLVFTANWCGFCKSTRRMLADAEKELKDVKFFTADIEKTTDLAKRYSVRGVPTTLFFKDGAVKNRRTGALTKAEVYALAERKPLQTTEA